MKFDMTNIHTIFEAAAEEKVDTKAAHDETGANLDNTLGDNDLLSIFDDICPITGDVFTAMKNAAKDPKNLKITITKNGDGEDPKLFVEAVEFMTFCEAGEYNIGEAVEEVIDTYKEEVPGLNNAEFHVVFPSDALNKNVLGSENYGKAVEDDWASRLMRGCLRYGIKVNSGVEDAPVDEAAVNEGFFNRHKEKAKETPENNNSDVTPLSKSQISAFISILKRCVKKYDRFKDVTELYSVDEVCEQYEKDAKGKYKNTVAYAMSINVRGMGGEEADDISSLNSDIENAIKESDKLNNTKLTTEGYKDISYGLISTK